MLRNFSLVAVMRSVSEPQLQLMGSMMVSIFALGLHLAYQPYTVLFYNKLETLSLASVVFAQTMSMALVGSEGESEQSIQGSGGVSVTAVDGISFLLVILHVLVLLMYVYAFLRPPPQEGAVKTRPGSVKVPRSGDQLASDSSKNRKAGSASSSCASVAIATKSHSGLQRDDKAPSALAITLNGDRDAGACSESTSSDSDAGLGQGIELPVFKATPQSDAPVLSQQQQAILGQAFASHSMSAAGPGAGRLSLGPIRPTRGNSRRNMRIMSIVGTKTALEERSVEKE